MYEELLGWANAWFLPSLVDASGRECVPMELKILASLRVLSKGWHFDGIAELSMMDEGTMRVWHHSFLAKFVEEKRSVFIKYPTTDAEAEVIERVFSALGMPGAVGSTD